LALSFSKFQCWRKYPSTSAATSSMSGRHRGSKRDRAGVRDGEAAGAGELTKAGIAEYPSEKESNRAGRGEQGVFGALALSLSRMSRSEARQLGASEEKGEVSDITILDFSAVPSR